MFIGSSSNTFIKENIQFVSNACKCQKENPITKSNI